VKNDRSFQKNSSNKVGENGTCARGGNRPATSCWGRKLWLKDYKPSLGLRMGSNRDGYD
jgi:hypothetical protein